MRGNKPWLVAAAVLAALVAAGLSRLHTLGSMAGDRWPFENRAGSLTHEIAELNKQVKTAALPRRDLHLAEQLLPSGADGADALKAIRDIAWSVGTPVISVEPPTPAASDAAWRTRGDGVWELPITVGLTGTYDAIAMFVNRLEGNGADAAARLFVVDDLDIAAEEDDRRSAELRIRAFAADVGDGVLDSGPDDAVELSALWAAQSYVYKGGGRDPMALLPKKMSAIVAIEPVAPAADEPVPPVVAEIPVDNLAEDFSAGPGEVPHGRAPWEERSAEVRRLADEVRQLRGPTPAESPPEPPAPPEPVVDVAALAATLVVQGVAWSPDSPRAFVNGAVVRVGDAIPLGSKGMTADIAAIHPDKVVFDIDGHMVEEKVALFEGKR